ncbi:MAG: LPS export ABC transporter periplasmic protein LptC [Bacteroidetes bacterium]|nr:MAG: LPS export ABC transporter periplasmic protein LptC [Bacteroidota bacterium]
MYHYYLFFLLLGLASCKDGLEGVGKKEDYDGPSIKAFNLKMQLSDSAKLRVEVHAPLQLEYQNGNQEYPKGVTVEFYNAEGKKYTRLTADKGKYNKATHIYTVWNNVVVKNIEKQEEMQTEELNWSPHAQDIYTTKRVKITTLTEILHGNGLKAKQDFMTYKIMQPTGKFTVKR